MGAKIQQTNLCQFVIFFEIDTAERSILFNWIFLAEDRVY